MRIVNLRAGFATNSSSSHSVILLPPKLMGRGRVKPIASHDPNTFGWEHFRLVSEETKLRYLAAQLFTNYITDLSAVRDIVDQIEHEMSGYAAEMQPMVDAIAAAGADEDIWVDRPSVDHQSVLTLPSDYNQDLVSGLIQFFKSPKVAVLGGNDNTDHHPNTVPGSEEVALLSQIQDRVRGGMRARRDGAFWVLFDSADGTKLRFSFDSDNLEASDYLKSSAPELVDVKITDWCDKGCRFCYQSSTTAGVHAPMEKIASIAAMLGEIGVFEVALGGGEPTAHPDFAAILHLFRQHGIVPSFTTFSDRWLAQPEIVRAVTRNVGGIGVSCLDAKGLHLVERIKTVIRDCDEQALSEGKIIAQHVVGSVPYDKTVEFLHAAWAIYTPILLLGFKPVGFGAQYERFDDDSLEIYLKLAIDAERAGGWGLSIDTALLNRYPNLPHILGAPDALVTSREGAFSCYIDATTDQCAASSYVLPEDMIALPATTQGFLDLYGTF